jgi:threonine aldolase
MTATVPIDLRSDTVTRPTPGMRRAIAEAVVGDDVFRDDPTVRALEDRISALTGKPAAVFVPSGTMGNQLAIHSLTRPGDEVIAERLSHIILYEQGGLGANSGCLAHPLDGPGGRIDPQQIVSAHRDSEDEHIARLSLVCVENTHNRSGGRVIPLAHVQTVAAAARSIGARVHLDGARLWNAAVASGVPIATWAGLVDTVTMCFSKGLGAPIGSMLAGPADVIHEARRARKRWGGAMRQVGILAAAALYALDHHVERLAEDHARARRLAARLRGPGRHVPEPETNIVAIELNDPALERDAVLAELERRGVAMIDFGADRIRAVTHLDVDDAQVDRAADVFQAVAAERLPAASRS